MEPGLDADTRVEPVPEPPARKAQPVSATARPPQRGPASRASGSARSAPGTEQVQAPSARARRVGSEPLPGAGLRPAGSERSCPARGSEPQAARAVPAAQAGRAAAPASAPDPPAAAGRRAAAASRSAARWSEERTPAQAGAPWRPGRPEGSTQGRRRSNQAHPRCRPRSDRNRRSAAAGPQLQPGSAPTGRDPSTCEAATPLSARFLGVRPSPARPFVDTHPPGFK